MLFAYRQRRWLKSKCSREVDPVADPELPVPDSEVEAEAESGPELECSFSALLISLFGELFI